MVRCYICNNPIETPVIDPRDNKIKPCDECLDIIESAAKVREPSDLIDVEDGDLVILDIIDDDLDEALYD